MVASAVRAMVLPKPLMKVLRSRSRPAALRVADVARGDCNLRIDTLLADFHAISAEPCVVQQRADIAVAKDKPGMQWWMIKDRPVFAEILEVGEWIVQVLGDVEEKFLTFSGVEHIPSCGEMT
jgi:hypothetical protein